MKVSFSQILVLFLVFFYLFGDFFALRHILKTYIVKFFKLINKNIANFKNRKKGS